ncbi:MAG: T9SS type A sorting domain-containing protein [Bacteroidia bacterium]
MKKTLLFIALIFSAVFVNAQEKGGLPATLVINEVDYDQVSADTAEFIELKNVSLNAIDLSTVQIYLYNGNSTTLAVYDTIFLPSYSLQPGAYYVICGNSGGVANCNQVEPIHSNMIENGSPDAIAIGSSLFPGVYADVLSYEGDCPSPWIEGTGVANANSDNNTDEKMGLSRLPDGTDTQVNSADFSLRCITPGAANTADNSNCGGLPIGIATVTKTETTLFPNPANDFVTISTGLNSGDVSVLVYDFTGKLIENKQLKNAGATVQYTTSELANGVYILSIKTADKTVTKKLTVLHR